MDNTGYSKSYADVFLAVAFSLAVLIALLLPLINPPQKVSEDAPNPQGNIIVELTWPDELDVDVDLWVRGEADMVAVGYSNKGGPLFNLLRDDLGVNDDLSRKNMEITYSRGVPDGEYIINAHLFNTKQHKGSVPIRLVVSLKENDLARGSQLFAVNAELLFYGEEKTLARFIIYDGKYIAQSFNTLQENIRGAY